MTTNVTMPMVERGTRVAIYVATVWFILAAAWGIDAVPGGGHLGSSGSAVAMFGEHIVKWHTFYPLYGWYGTTKPGLESAYCHHPFGVDWSAAFFAFFFHHRDFLISLPAVLMSGATVPLLAGVGRRFGGPLAGAATAIGFVVLPITIGYSCFASLEVTTMFGVALFFWGHLAYQEHGRRVHLVASLAGALFTGCGDWAGYLIVAPLLAWCVMRANILPSWMTPAIHARRYQHWWALSVCALTCTLGITLAMFKHADKLEEWLRVADTRSGAIETPLKTVLEARKTWIEFSFTPPAIALGKLIAPLAILRTLLRRRDEDVMSLAVLFGATVQYVAFKRGADVHIFWPHYYGMYFALAMGQLTASVQSLVEWLAARFDLGARARIAGVLAAIMFGVVPSLLIFPDGARSLRIWRETGGRYNDKGALFRTNVELLWLLQELVRPELHPGEIVGQHPGTPWGWEAQWAIAGLSEMTATPGAHQRFWVGRGSGMTSDEMKKIVAGHHVKIYGDVLVVDAASSAAAPLDAYSLAEREPNVFEWYFRYNTEPVLTLSPLPDPFLTWEWRSHLGQTAAFPTGEPRTLDERRIAHNVAVARGDGAAAEKLREQIVAELDRTVEAHFTGDHELIGVRVTHGSKPMIEAWFEAGGPTSGDTTFAIHSVVERPARFSFIAADPTERDMAYPPWLSTKLWKRGYLYRIEAELNHRIGLERYVGFFVSRDGQPAPAAKHGSRVDLAVVP